VVNEVIDIGAYEYTPPVGGVTLAPEGLAQLGQAAGLLASLAAVLGSGMALARRRKT
jgi:hypothetical protein